jgi:uncharacterized protein (UPF0261 family)
VKDITMMYSVVDIAGLNPLSRRILANAAGAICGMVEQGVPEARDRPLIAATMFGVTTPCVMRCGAVWMLPATRSSSSMRRVRAAARWRGSSTDGWFVAVADVTTTEWCDEVVGGVLSAGPDRLSAAGRGHPPGRLGRCHGHGQLRRVRDRAGALPRTDAVPTQRDVTLMRTTAAECRGSAGASRRSFLPRPVRRCSCCRSVA